MTVLRENARISKENLNKLIRGIRGGLYVQETKTVHSPCVSCPYKNKSGLFKEYCEQYCNKKEVEKSFKKINTIKKVKETQKNSDKSISRLEMEYVVKDHDFIQPSKSVIKQYIFYHFLVWDQYHIRKNITAQLVADELNISTATVRRNNKLLEELGLIHIRKVEGSIFDIFIYGEDNLYLKKEEGGKGFLPLPQELYNKIKIIQDVNVLRLELKKILKIDADKNLKREIKPGISEIRISSMVEVIPYYLRRAKKKLKEKIFSKQAIFKLEVSKEKENICNVDISGYKTGESFNKNFMQNTKTSLVEFVEKQNIPIIPNDLTLLEVPEENRKILYEEKIADLAQLSLEYGVQTIRDILIYIKHRYIEGENIVIENIGAFVRTIIKMFISQVGSNFKLTN